MSHTEEHMEQLFAEAKNLPAEFSIGEVEMIFLNPVPLPPAKPWYGGYPKLFTMLSLLLTLAFAVTSSGPTGRLPLNDSPPAEITLQPTAVTIPPAKDITLPVEEPEVPAPALTNPIPAAVPQLPTPTLAPLRFIAPAAAPPALVFPTGEPSPPSDSKSTTTPPTGNLSTSSQASPVFSGDWKLRKNILQLSLLEITSDQQQHHFNLPIALTRAEAIAVEDREVASGKIERAAGTILVHGGKKRGTFEFIPNADFRDRLNAAGMGDQQLPAGENPRLPVLPALIQMGYSLDTDHPRELLWLKYFVYDVNDSYVKVLKDHGYTDTDLIGLYHLPDYGVKRLTLINLLSLTDKLFAERVPVKDLGRMSWRITYLNSLISMGHSELTLEEFWSTEALGSFGLKFPMGPDSLTRPLIGQLGRPGMLPDSIPYMFARPLLNSELPENWGEATPGRTAAELDVKAFNKLVVKGKIRIYLNYSDAPREVVVFASPAVRSSLTVRQSGKKLKLENTHPTEMIDVEISGPLLKRFRYMGEALFFNRFDNRD